MPPKKDTGPSKKTVAKAQEKVIDDKTFGLKNKNKSKTVQNFVKSVAVQVKGLNTKGGESKRIADEMAQKAAQKKEEEKKALLASLFKSVKKVQEDVEEEVEEVVEDKYEEIDLYVDQRNQIFGGDNQPGGAEEEELANWKNNKNERVCKFFLDAVEAGKYGWRWHCPNGLGCIYKHCLPAGYILKRDMPTEGKKDVGALEEELERERALLVGGTPVTLERFLKWKEEKKIKKEKEAEQKRVEESKKPSRTNELSGRALFSFNPNLFEDDDEALDDQEYEIQEVAEEEEEKEERNYEDDEDEDEDGEGEGEGEGEEAKEEDDEEVPGATTEATGTENATETAAVTGEAKKKKKKKNKKKADGDNPDVKINEDVFLNEEDVELPEDES